jgi:predicted Zn-dependent protease with MMP-like domain
VLVNGRLAIVTREEFEYLVSEALDELPQEFAERLVNVEVVVEDEPGLELLRSMGLDPQRDTLFGLYQGVPLHLRGDSYGGVLPDKITIFYRPLLRACRTPDRIRRQVRRTVIHEIGHFFGLNDRAIRDLGY